MKDSTRKRHIAKAITYRTIGTIDTILLSWFISGDPMVGLKIGGAEVITKMIIYYFHERIWFKFDFGLNDSGDSQKRHILKTFSWRIVGTADTMLLAWIISGDPLIGLKVGLLEVVTKMIIYYLHERAWYKINFGLEERRSNTTSLKNE